MTDAVPTFTILLPVHRPPALLRYAVRSVLWQERSDWELLIVCDGAPDATVETARSLAAADARIKVFAHPKGPRLGEIYRHQALEHARGECVAQIADDDIWFPNHLSELAQLLRVCDFGHLTHVMVRPDGFIGATLGDLTRPAVRKRILDKNQSHFGPTVWGFRLATYRALPEGWATTPPELGTDVYMTQKFLRHPGIRAATRFAVTSLHFPAPGRNDMDLAQRENENRLWFERASDPERRDNITQPVCLHVVHLAREELMRRAKQIGGARAAADH